MLVIFILFKALLEKNKQQDARIEELEAIRKVDQWNDFMEREDSKFLPEK